jgi:hypothetical protein
MVCSLLQVSDDRGTSNLLSKVTINVIAAAAAAAADDDDDDDGNDGNDRPSWTVEHQEALHYPEP